MRVMFSRLFVGLLLTGLSVSGVVAQEKKQQVAEELPARIEPDQAKWYAHYKKQANAPNPDDQLLNCLLYTSPSPRDKRQSRMPSSA